MKTMEHFFISGLVKSTGSKTQDALNSDELERKRKIDGDIIFCSQCHLGFINTSSCHDSYVGDLVSILQTESLCLDADVLFHIHVMILS